MTFDAHALLVFWAAFGLALLSPGPNFALMLKIGLAGGRGPALRTVLGIALGEAVWGCAALFGVAALASRHPQIGTAIRLAGGCFLLWLAWGALRSAWRGTGQEAMPAQGTGAAGGFATGLASMLLNPKAGFFWVSLTSALLGADASPATAALAVLVAVLLSLLWHGLLALAFSGRRATQAYARARSGIDGMLGLILGALGLRLLVTS